MNAQTFPTLDHVRTSADTRQLAAWCFETIGPGFHPDTDVRDYVTPEDVRAFGPADSAMLNRLIDEAFAVCDDFYRICLEEMQRLGFAPPDSAE